MTRIGVFRRHAILKNKQFAFLEELTKEIPTTLRGEELEQLAKTPTNTGKLAFLMRYSDLGLPTTSDQFHSITSTSPKTISNYDLNANTSQRPVQFTKEQEKSLINSALSVKQNANTASDAQFSVPKVPSIKSSAPIESGKRKRGRPRKETKEK